MSLLVRNARVLTLAGPRPRRGAALRDPAALPRADVLVEGDTIAAVAPSINLVRAPDVQIDARGRVLLPGLVDCHTHACWAGQRVDEWQRLLRGEKYLDILASGGGIMATVRAVRAASQEDLVEGLVDRLDAMLRHGATTVEVKSGYGLSTRDELKMLRAIRDAARRWPGTLVPTALLGHAVDPDDPAFIDRTIAETLPAVSEEFPGIAVDAYCERGAWSVADAVRLFEAALARGHPVRVHADQFNSLGMLPEAIRLEAVSVDHLEASTPGDLGALARSGSFGVILPVCGLHTDGRYAGVRRFIDEGGALALATNCNPGSAPCVALPMAIALASRFCGLLPEEAVAVCTANPATLLGLHDRGTIAPGQRADLVLLRHTDERYLAYEVGANPVETVICGGVPVAPAPTR